MAQRLRAKRTFTATAIALVVSPLAICAPAEAAATTIGQLAPGSPAQSATCAAFTSVDRLQQSVSSGASYVVPDRGTAISSWSTNASLDPNQTLTLKVFRKSADPATYRIVAHDTRAITPGLVNTFSVDLPVQPGDVIGSTTSPGTSGCAFAAPDAYLFLGGSLADSPAGSFGSTPGSRLNLSAVVALAKPDNTFSFLGTKLNRKTGTAIVTVSLPGPGSLSLAGRGLIATTLSGAGAVPLLVQLKPKARRRLRRHGEANVSVRVTFTPNGGDPNTFTAPVTLKKGRKKRR